MFAFSSANIKYCHSIFIAQDKCGFVDKSCLQDSFSCRNPDVFGFIGRIPTRPTILADGYRDLGMPFHLVYKVRSLGDTHVTRTCFLVHNHGTTFEIKTPFDRVRYHMRHASCFLELPVFLGLPLQILLCCTPHCLSRRATRSLEMIFHYYRMEYVVSIKQLIHTMK